MAATVALHHPEIHRLLDGIGIGSQPGFQIRTGVIAMDSAYPTGGEAILATAFNLDSISFLRCPPVGGYVPEWDYANAKLKVFYGDTNAVADGALIEVPNATDLSVLLAAVRFLAIGTVSVPHEAT